MEHRVRLWIDARQEQLQPGRYQEVNYVISGIKTQSIRETIYQTLAVLVKEIQIAEEEDFEKVKIIYDPERITPSFIDYLLSQKGVEFRRLNP
ncbi:hypothetical protein [Neomoorella humiferrea]|uniref:Uncharacterized protein n=1 Tax=Neomoorella humiferrea TaxID=676965 RepID=A0A2T0AQ45_9FIRM|nr:hypothetical protein [Moorella humiferrea]PRR71170.1 hypothetical protein MOHU_17160 [Moorella humiferrea]